MTMLFGEKCDSIDSVLTSSRMVCHVCRVHDVLTQAFVAAELA